MKSLSFQGITCLSLLVWFCPFEEMYLKYSLFSFCLNLLLCHMLVSQTLLIEHSFADAQASLLPEEWRSFNYHKNHSKKHPLGIYLFFRQIFCFILGLFVCLFVP